MWIYRKCTIYDKNTILSIDKIKTEKENKNKFNLVAYCEIDKYASKAYSLIHNVGEDLNLGDITKVNTNKLPNNIDFIFHGSPCQSFSLAGKQHGGDKGSGTRSSLMWETVRIVKESKPKVVCWENVKNVISKKHIHNFDEYIDELNDCGYNSYYKVLNSKDYGIPQNRERIFVVSIRKDIDNGKFSFPKPHCLDLRLKDMLEDNVDDKYYLKQEQIERMLRTTYESGKYKNRVTNENGIINTLCARDYKDPKCIEIENILNKNNVFDFRYDEGIRGRVDKNLSPTLTTKVGGTGLSGQPFVKLQSDSVKGYVSIPKKTKKGYKEAYDGDGVYINRPHQKRGCVQKGMIPTLKTSRNDVGVVIDKQLCVGTHGYAMGNIEHNLKIRKLTPKECWRLMGFDDNDIDKCINAKLSNTQLYKMAGNSIVVNVLYYIFLELYRVLPEVFTDLNMLSLFSGIGAPEKALERIYENIN